MWVCGLKQFVGCEFVVEIKSHPMWVCGLKPNYALRINHPYKVTPYVGVWIETFGFRTN